MKGLSIFLYEWKHFVRSPFKLVALLLFVVAAGYGLHNGASLYEEQLAQIQQIEQQIEEQREEYMAYYKEGKPGPENAPWIDMSTPFWSIWFNGTYHFKNPSPTMVYSMGQAEQYGFYKRVTFWASPYDADMTKEIANPERLQTGTLDFAFALLFLLPLLLLILLYNLKSMEAEQGFLPLIEVQTAAKYTWLLSRVAFYVGLVFLVLMGLLLYGASLTTVFTSAAGGFGQILLYSALYLLFWATIYYLLLFNGTTVMGNTLRMVGVWLILAFLIPAGVHQWVSIEKPANLMTDLIDATREERQKLYDRPDSVIQAQLNDLFPEIVDSPVARDSSKTSFARSYSASAYVNELMKESIAPIEAENQVKNKLVRASYWFNPLTYFQNRINRISQTHYDDYQAYRDEIQGLIDRQIQTMVVDTWNEVKVDQEKFVDYHKILNTY